MQDVEIPKKQKGRQRRKKENAEAVLEFYHGYYHEESEWPAAKVMRDIYEEFAKSHADGKVKFKPIAVENRDDIVVYRWQGQPPRSCRLWNSSAAITDC